MNLVYHHRRLAVLTLLSTLIFDSVNTNGTLKITLCNSTSNDDNNDYNDKSDIDINCAHAQELVTLSNFGNSKDGTSTEEPSTHDTSENEDESHIWKVLDDIQVTILFVGLAGNVFTIYLLAKNKGHIPPVASVLIIHQALMDALVCTFMIPTFLTPAFWTTGNPSADTFFCHIWHSQVLFWWALLMSVWTLVLMSIDRFIAVKYPLKYNLVRPKHFMRALIGIYVIMFLVALPAVFEFSYNKETKECTSDFYSDSKVFSNFISTYGLIWFASAYGIPVPLLFIFYGMILHLLRTRIKNTNLGESTIIINANTQATKTFGYVTAFFIFSFSFDSWYYLLYTVGAVEYVYHSPIQVISVFMTALNSCVNPFIYAASMAFIRRAIRDMFCGRCLKSSNDSTKKGSTSTLTAATSKQSVSTIVSP